MGNENSSTTKKSSKTTAKPVLKKIPVQGPIFRNYQPPNDKRNDDSQIQSKNKVPEKLLPSVYHLQKPNSPHSKQPTPTVQVQQSSSVANKERSTPVPTREQSSSISVQKHLSPSVIEQQISSPSVIKQQISSSSVIKQQLSSPSVIKQQISSPSHNISIPISVTTSSFEKAPMIQLNYVVKSSDNKSIHTYGPGNMTIMRRTTSQTVPHGNRWYDKDYNKNVKTLIVK